MSMGKDSDLIPYVLVDGEWERLPKAISLQRRPIYKPMGPKNKRKSAASLKVKR